MAEQQRIREYIKNVNNDSIDICHQKGSYQALQYQLHKSGLLELYKIGEITLRELNDEF